ncbi:MAG: alpha-amylase [Prosthecochloris sp.]|uniref:alpha-amylase family glycosyl hydrolase n=1 Tax=Prosthecochloris sp. ZM_2 TaxID=2045206 RepID=UPI000DF7237E|nr:alpha-amylase [Prosthecochloris sp. ZM_2]MEC9487042.1 alpha-amylase [Prosthecochloris sp.]RNA64776.1 alpha-amylase [Prosthecochloris sp. ZM_2]
MKPSTPHLEKILAALEDAKNRHFPGTYHIPRLWQDDETGTATVNPARYYHDILSRIAASPETPIVNSAESADDWTRRAVVYNLFPRLTTAFDHNRDSAISPEPLPGGFRETGTFLKSIALLPYIRRLGANTVYLLPVTTPGNQQKKGALGSPYAVKNHFDIDPMLHEPVLGLSAETELKAFIEAAHHMGIRVVLEYVFRTASVDNDWIPQHPDWFYWLDETLAETFEAPHFDQDTLNRIYEQVDKHDFTDLPQPSEEYRARFCPTPATVSQDTTGTYLGITGEGSTCRIASAFSDWPPDDRQPPWTDVTYLKMHSHKEFNYIAYNTIRMYDDALDRPEHTVTDLWDTLIRIIPHYQKTFAIDGAMIDMGHALPPRLKSGIVAEARKQNPAFAFWDENFDPSPSIKKEGFNAVFGSLPFVLQDPIYIRGLLNFLNKTGVAVPFFATGENHNTPRICHQFPRRNEGRNRARFIFALGIMLPAIPFIHSGMELCEWHPVNLGLNFSDRDRENFPVETLPLFSPAGYDWTEANELAPLHPFLRKALVIRERYHDIVSSGDKGSLVLPFVSSPDILAVLRKGRDRNLLFIGNSNPARATDGIMEFQAENLELMDLLNDRPRHIRNHKLEFRLDPGESIICELPA